MQFDPESVKNIIKNDEVLSKLDDASINSFLESMAKLTPEEIDQYMQYQKTLLSMGFPSCKIMMTILLNHSMSTDIEVKNKFIDTIETSTNVEKVGGMNIEYIDSDTNIKTYCYIIMNKCERSHNILPQLNKIQKHFNEEQWKDILKNISMMIYLCKNIYKLTIATCTEKIFNLGYDINDIEELKLDETNMTLYLEEDWDERVGIYIMRECDLDEEKFILENNITSNDITNNNITSNDITNNNITSNDITNNNITSNEITNNNITSNEI